jgi:hypothetical protein
MARGLAYRLQSRVKYWQKRLLLSDWSITVLVGALDDLDERADCDAKPQYKEGVIRLDPKKIPEAEWDAYCVHELLHCVTWRLEALAEEWGRSESQYVVARETAETVVTDLERIILGLAKR